jgi:prefoldin subunit 5
MSDVEVSDRTSVGLPLRNLIGLASAVAVGTWAWFGTMERLNQHDMRLTLMRAEVDSNSEFSEQLQRGEISTASSRRCILLLEHTSRQLQAVEVSISEGKAVSVNKQQELTINFLSTRVDSLEAKIEMLRDKLAEMKSKSNGNGVH